MADQELQILIETLSKTHGADAVSDALRKTKAEAEKANTEIKQGAEKAEISHRSLHAAIRQLHHEFPLLGRLAHAALNPLAFSVAGIIAAFEIWKHRVKELTDTMVSMQLPDNSPMDPKRVNAITIAWEKFGDAVRKVKEAHGSVTAAAERENKVFEKQVEEMKKLHPEMAVQIDNDAEAVRRKMQLAHAVALEAEAQAKLAAAGKIKIATSEEDAKTEEELRKQSEAAKKGEDEARKRKGDLVDFQGGAMAGISNAGRKAAFLKDFYMRYGLNTTGTQALDLENQNIEATRAPQDRLREFLQRKHERDRLRAGRDELVAGATKSGEEAAGLRAGLGDEDPGVRSGVEAATTAGAGGRLTKAQQLSVAHLQALLRQSGYTQNQVVDMLAMLRDQQVTIAQKIQNFQASLIKIDAKIKSTVNP